MALLIIEEITNQTESQQIKSNEMLVFGERVENQQTQPTEDRGSGNRTCATLVEGQCSYHCATPVLNVHVFALLKSLLEFLEDRIPVSNDPDLVLGAIQCLCDLAHHLHVRLVSVSDPVLFCPDPGL